MRMNAKQAAVKADSDSKFRSGGESGPFCALAFNLDVNRTRCKLTQSHYHQLQKYCAVCAVFGAFLLSVTCLAVTGVIELCFQDFDIEHSGTTWNETVAAFTVDELFFADRRCVGATAGRVQGWLMLILWSPGCVVASVVWPLWMISLQLGTTLANDDVEDLMRKLDPTNVRQRFSTLHRLNSERNWQREVALPGALLVSTMEELSHWGLE